MPQRHHLVHGVVLGQQHAQSLGAATGGSRRRCSAGGRAAIGPARRPRARSVNQNVRALARRCSHADLAAHQLDELPADRQAEAGAAVAARRRAVGLRERLEQLRLCRRPGCRCRCRAPRSAADASRGRRRRPRPRPRPALLGELDRVADEVDQHLPQPAGSPTSASGTSGATSQRQLEALLACGPRREQASSESSTTSRRSNGDASSSSLPASIFEKSRMSLMIVEQRLAPTPDRCPAKSRCSASSVVVEQQLGHADDAVHRRADLVAHVGEELGLEPRRFERRVARRRQLGLDLLVSVMSCITAQIAIGARDVGVEPDRAFDQAAASRKHGRWRPAPAAAHAIEQARPRVEASP